MDGRVVVAPGVALIWLPWNGQVVAKIPAVQGNRRGLHRTVNIRSPRLDNQGSWHLPRTCLGRRVLATIDRYGCVVLCRDMTKLTRCSRKCQEAEGLECNCSCRGAHHGEEDPDGWFERVGDVIVDERGEFTRTLITYGPKGSGAGARIYSGELLPLVPPIRRGGTAAVQLVAIRDAHRHVPFSFQT